jgi:glycerol-3-phosphate acyltransferase PlsY|tara:strand:+ start:662 stop:1237 length:576 start_codon:yes stop_codon:yes gene_type:complete
MEISLIILISYLLGSIPFGFLLTKIILKKDIREIGSGNIGATNVLRTGNKIIGYSTLILDILKAVIPILFIKMQFPEFIFISSLAVFLGHVFPIWLKFNGGKGVATYVGILFCINYILGFFFIATWLVVFFISKYSSLSSLLASLIIPIYYFFIDTENYYFFIIMFILIFYTHRENIKRLKNNTESKTKIY